MRLVTSGAAAAALVAFSIGTSLLAAPMVLNPGFETPQYVNDIHKVNPTDTGVAWTFTPSTLSGFETGAGSGIDRGRLYGSTTNSDANSGSQLAFIQGSGDASVMSISQSISGFDVGTQYTVSFYAKAIGGNAAFSVNPFTVSVGATTLTFSGDTTVTPPLTESYTLYTSAPFTTNSTSTVLRFAESAAGAYTRVSFIDDVSIATVPEPTALAAVGSLACLFMGRRQRA